MSLILSISTSSQMASIALVKSGSVLSEPISTSGQKSHTQALAPMIDEMFASFAISCDDIDCFAVDTGPGSFTGVRIGVATANGLSMASGKPIIGVSSLLALRYHQLEISPVATIIDAHNDNVYAAIYFNKKAVLSPCAMCIDELIEKLPLNTLCVGDGALVHQLRISELQPTAKFASEENNIIKASCIGLAAWDKIQECGSPKEAATGFVLPTYLKMSQAEMLHNAKKNEEEAEKSSNENGNE